MDLYRALGLTEQNLAARRQFLRLGPEDRQVLDDHVTWIEQHVQEIVREVYDFQFSFPSTLRVFRERAAEGGISPENLREHLERTLSDEVVEMFRGARTDWGPEYARRLIRVGMVHDKINLPQKWYFGAYARLFELIGDRLAAQYPKGPIAWQVCTALQKVLNLGMQVAADSFFMSYVLGAGFDASTIAPETPDADATEQVEKTKEQFQTILGQFGAIARNDLKHGILDRTTPGSLGDAVKTTVANARYLLDGIEGNSEALEAVSAAANEMRQAVEEISQNTSAAVVGMQQAETLTDSATQRMGTLSERSQEIGNVVKLITSIAEQTNLLALNATIEAARSGEAGRGFAVVANEVKELARQAGDATEQIRQRIEAMQGETSQAVSAIEQISEAIGSVAEASQSIASAVEEQSAVNDKLAHDMDQAVTRTHELLGRR